VVEAAGEPGSSCEADRDILSSLEASLSRVGASSTLTLLASADATRCAGRLGLRQYFASSSKRSVLTLKDPSCSGCAILCPASCPHPLPSWKSALQGARTYRARVATAPAPVLAYAHMPAHQKCVRARASVLRGGYEDRGGWKLTAGARCALAGRARPRAPARNHQGDHKVLHKRSNADHLQVDSVHLPPYSSPSFPNILAAVPYWPRLRLFLGLGQKEIF
jgi:hypothetical protein